MDIFLTIADLKEIALSALENETLTNIEEPINKIIFTKKLLEIQNQLKEIKKLSDPKSTNLLIQLSQHNSNIAMMANKGQSFGLIIKNFPANGWEY